MIVITPFFGKWKPLVLVFPRYGSTSSTQSVIEESEDSLGEALGVSLGLELGDDLGSFLSFWGRLLCKELGEELGAFAYRQGELKEQVESVKEE